jgi:hypothetical protein
MRHEYIPHDIDTTPIIADLRIQVKQLRAWRHKADLFGIDNAPTLGDLAV